MQNLKETGQASLLIELVNGDIVVKHGTEQNVILLEKKDVAKGSWDKIWEVLNSL